jgi:hypothetical protein
MGERVLHTRRAATDDEDGDKAHHDEGGKFRNPWVDADEFDPNKKLLGLAKFMWASKTQQAKLPNKEEVARIGKRSAIRTLEWSHLRG